MTAAATINPTLLCSHGRTTDLQHVICTDVVTAADNSGSAGNIQRQTAAVNRKTLPPGRVGVLSTAANAGVRGTAAGTARGCLKPVYICN